MSKAAFVARYGGLFEHSPWIAEAAWEAGARAEQGADAVLAAMAAQVRAAPREKQLALVRAHPDLAGRAALTDASMGEQAGAGLEACSPGEFARFQELNAAYAARFGFPFVMAVKGADRMAILAGFEGRLGNAPKAEFATALAEIEKIAGFRLQSLAEEAP